MRLALDTNRYVDLCKGVGGTSTSITFPKLSLFSLR